MSQQATGFPVEAETLLAGTASCSLAAERIRDGRGTSANRRVAPIADSSARPPKRRVRASPREFAFWFVPFAATERERTFGADSADTALGFWRCNIRVEPPETSVAVAGN